MISLICLKALYGSVIIEVDGLKANGSLGSMFETVKLGFIQQTTAS